MNSHIFRGLASLAIALSINSGWAKPAEKYRQFQLGGIAVSLSLERNTESSEKIDWPDEPVKLTSQAVTVNGKTINELLLNANIFPDVEAFTLVYTLNPKIRDLKKLTVATISIPKIDAGDKLKTAFANGVYALVTVELDRKQKFGLTVQKLSPLVDKVSKFESDRFQNQLARDTIVNSLKHSSEILDAIAEQFRERYGRPVPKIVLAELYAQAELLNNILSTNIIDKKKFDQNEQDKIREIESDLSKRSRAFKEVAAAGDPPPSWDTVEVTVKTVQSGKLIPNLRIWYIAKISRDPDTLGSFGMLSTDHPDAPAKGMIYEGDLLLLGRKRSVADTCD